MIYGHSWVPHCPDMGGLTILVNDWQGNLIKIINLIFHLNKFLADHQVPLEPAPTRQSQQPIAAF